MKPKQVIKTDLLKAVFYKEVLNLRYNLNILIISIVPLIFLAFFSSMPLNTWVFLVSFTLFFLPIQIQGNLLVEEKEQKTQRILQQQGVTLYSLTLIKGLFSLTITLVMIFLVIFLNGLGFKSALLICIFSLPPILIMLSIGTIIAALSANKTEVNIWETPFVILFIALEIIRQILSNNGWVTIAAALPNHHLYQSIEHIPYQGIAAFWPAFPLFLATSIVFVATSAYVLHKRKQTF